MASLKEISETFDFNERTIRYDIEKINKTLAESGLEEIKKMSKGIFQGDVLSLKKIIFDAKNSPSTFSSEYKDILILIKIIFDEEININSLCEEFNLGRTTIKTTLKNVKDILDLYNLKLILNPKKGLKLQGSEENIRRVQLKLLNQYITEEFSTNFEKDFIKNNIQEYFQNINTNTIKIFINYVIKILNRIISDEDHSTLSNYIYIMILRIKNNKTLDFVQNESFFSETVEYEVIAKSSTLLEANYGIILNNFELLKLTDYFLGSHSYSLSPTFYNNWIEIEILTKRIINSYSELCKCSLSRDSSLLDGLINHIKPTIYRIKNKIELENSIIDEFMDLYPTIYQNTKSSLSLLEEFLGENIPEDEIAFIGMHFKAALDRNKVEKKESKNILIVCGLGYGTSKLLAQQIREHYNVNIIATIPFNQISSYVNNPEIDLIISTLAHSNFETEIPVVTIKTLLGKEDLNLLDSYNLTKYNKKIILSSLVEKIENSSIVLNKTLLLEELKELLGDIIIDDLVPDNLRLSDFLTEESIILNAVAKTWEEAIKIAGDLLVKNNCTTDLYTEQMIDLIEKKGSYMVITDFVALPHGKNDHTTLKTGLVLITLDKEVEFPQGIKVNTILAFSSKDNKEHLHPLTEFIDLLKKHSFFKLLREGNSKKKIIEQIKKYEFLSHLGKGD